MLAPTAERATVLSRATVRPARAAGRLGQSHQLQRRLLQPQFWQQRSLFVDLDVLVQGPCSELEQIVIGVSAGR